MQPLAPCFKKDCISIEMIFQQVILAPRVIKRKVKMNMFVFFYKVFFGKRVMGAAF